VSLLLERSASITYIAAMQILLKTFLLSCVLVACGDYVIEPANVERVSTASTSQAAPSPVPTAPQNLPAAQDRGRSPRMTTDFEAVSSVLALLTETTDGPEDAIDVLLETVAYLAADTSLDAAEPFGERRCRLILALTENIDQSRRAVLILNGVHDHVDQGPN
jgi:hypothetical protein